MPLAAQLRMITNVSIFCKRKSLQKGLYRVSQMVVKKVQLKLFSLMKCYIWISLVTFGGLIHTYKKRIKYDPNYKRARGQ